MRGTRHGTLAGAPLNLVDSALRRLWAQVEIGRISDCWIYTGTLKDDGYAQIRLGGDRRPYVHRLVYESLNGPVSPDLCVMHTCDNRRCVSPWHLRPGTHQDNMRDRDAKRRNGDMRGERNPAAKITAQTAKEIRRLGETGLKQGEVGRRLGISASIAGLVLRGRTWRHV